MLVRQNHIHLAKPRRRTSMADGIDLRRLAFGVTRRPALPPIGRSRHAVASLPEIGRASLIRNPRNHPALLAALDFPERVAAELKVVALLVDRITSAPVDQHAV